MANAVNSSNGYDGGGGSGGGGRAPRLPRWTRQEILVLIQGKRVVEGRGRRRSSATAEATPVEPKWAAVSAYCRRHGVERGAVQCRKRWSNLAGDFKKIKEWETTHGGGKDSFWAMRNDLRRERRLPGFFDREVYDILDGAAVTSTAEVVAVEGETSAVFDSGRGAAEEGLFSDGEEEEKEAEEDDEGREEERPPAPPSTAATAAEPLAVRVMPTSGAEKYFQHESSGAGDTVHLSAGTTNEKQPAENLEQEPSSHEGHEQAQQHGETHDEQSRATSADVQQQLVQVLEKNSRMIAAQLEAQNLNCQLDRDQQKQQADGLLNILGKLADAVGRIADKL